VGDLSITALYTAETWRWGGLPCAELFATAEGKRVFDVTNAALGVARLVRRDFAPLRHSLVHRHLMIDYLLREANVHDVIELAAGLSRRGATVSADPRIRYVELDLPAVVAKKRALLDRTEEGRAVLARDNLSFVGADALSADLAAWCPRDRPLFVIAEGLLMYLSAEAQRRLFVRIAALADIASEVHLAFDLVPGPEQPAPGRIGRALEAAMKRFTGGRTFERDTRTRADIRADLARAGFTATDAIAPREIANAWHLPHAERPTQTIVFTASRATRS
jgi:O-methyltransferase involved in polyketide biosynthesis